MKDIHNNGMEWTNQVCMTALKEMAGLVERLTRDERKLDNEMKE